MKDNTLNKKKSEVENGQSELRRKTFIKNHETLFTIVLFLNVISFLA